MRLPNGRMAAGAPAGLVLTRARTINELLSRPQNDRVVLYAGKQIDRTLPDYRELDAVHPSPEGGGCRATQPRAGGASKQDSPPRSSFASRHPPPSGEG